MRVLAVRQLGAVCVLVACAAVGLASAAHGEPAVASEQDATFYRLLTEPDDDDPGLVITDFGLVRAQGLLYCQRLDSGFDKLDMLHQMQAEGPYSFDVANSISSAAVISYCHHHFQY